MQVNFSRKMRRTARLRSRFLYRVKKMAKLTAATKGIELISGLNTFFSLIIYAVDHFDVKLSFNVDKKESLIACSNSCILYRDTLDSGINVGVRSLILGLCSSGYVLIKGVRLSTFLFFNLLIFFYFFLGLC